MLKWLWCNKTNVFYGKNCITEHIEKYIMPYSNIFSIFEKFVDYSAIQKNKFIEFDFHEIDMKLKNMHCLIKKRIDIFQNQNDDQLHSIIESLKEMKPDVILVIGGNLAINCAKYILNEAIRDDNSLSSTTLGFIVTSLSCGSGWNSNIIPYIQDMKKQHVYPKFTMIDPKYSYALNLEYLKKSLINSLASIIDQYLTPEEFPMFDNMWLFIFQELIVIGNDLINGKVTTEIYQRLIYASLFSNNGVFALAKAPFWDLQTICYYLSKRYSIEYEESLSMIIPPFLESQLVNRMTKLSKAAEFVFGIYDGTKEEKIYQFISLIRSFIQSLGMPLNLSACRGIQFVRDEDLHNTVLFIMKSIHSNSFGDSFSITETVLQTILKQIMF